MPRPQTFNKTAVTEAAMHLFWAQGYVATGMSQILETTGLKPGSFYNAFSDKKALFIGCLEHYRKHVVAVRVAEYLETPADPLEAIEGFFSSTFAALPRDQLIGCLLTNSATEIGKRDGDIERAIWKGLRQIEHGFKRRLEDATRQGVVNPSLDINATALHLLSCYQGLCVIGRLTQNKAKLRSLTQSALASLG